MTPAASAPPPITPEVLPVPLGDQSPLPPRRPGARLWAAATALAAVLVLLGIALYALLSLASALTAAGSRAYRSRRGSSPRKSILPTSTPLWRRIA